MDFWWKGLGTRLWVAGSVLERNIILILLSKCLIPGVMIRRLWICELKKKRILFSTVTKSTFFLIFFLYPLIWSELFFVIAGMFGKRCFVSTCARAWRGMSLKLLPPRCKYPNVINYIVLMLSAEHRLELGCGEDFFWQVHYVIFGSYHLWHMHRHWYLDFTLRSGMEGWLICYSNKLSAVADWLTFVMTGLSFCW